MKTISLEELTKFLIFRNKDCIITFSNSNKFDVNKENYIGHEDFHKELFYKNLVEVTNSKDFSTANFISISFSSVVKTLASPKVPPKIIPFTPAASCTSRFFSNNGRSNLSSAVNFVVSAGITPVHCILMSVIFF